MSRWILALILVVAALAGLFFVHHLLGRPDRVLAAQLEAELKSVRDQIARYEYETGVQPPDLRALTPDYLREDQIEGEDGARYVYDAKQRVIREAQGPLIKGLFRYRMAPRQFEIEKPERAAAERSALVRAAREDGKPAPRASDENSPLELLVASESGGPEAQEPPPGALVFEAEHFSELNYGWEARPDKLCAGGAYLHCKEGIANGPGQTQARVGDFYQARGTRELTALRYHFHIPADGKYHIYGRMFTTDTHCSNHVCIAVDKGGPQIGGMGNTTPFRFMWCPMEGSPLFLTQGDHFLHAFIHEDGVRIDQFVISPAPLSGDAVYKSNYVPGQGAAFESGPGAPSLLTFDLKNSVITPSMPPDCRLALRRLRLREGKARVRVKLLGADDGRDLVVAQGVTDLAKLPDLSFLPLDFGGLDWEKLPRREYLLRAELFNDAGPLAEAQTVLRRPYAYETFGPGKFLELHQGGPLDKDGQPVAGDTRKWTPFADKNWQELGVLDFGLQASNNSLHPVQGRTIYARTRIKVAKAGVYLFKLQSDDQMILWLDEKEIFRQPEVKPVTRNAAWEKVELSAGEHRLRMRVNQYYGRWQATLIIRGETDDITPDVVGAP
jgi:hypothetical protein